MLLTYDDPTAPAVEQVVKKKSRFHVPNKVWIMVALVFGFAGSLLWGFIQAGTPGMVIAVFSMLPLGALVFLTYLIAPNSAVSVRTRLTAVAWGGMGATSATFLIIGLYNKFFTPSNFIDSVVVQAAVVEEIGKALILFILLIMNRSALRSPVAGMVIGFLSGAGFAFVENIMYFGRALLSGGWGAFWEMYLMRAVQSFFLHSLATMFTGMLLGWLLSREMHFLKKVFWFVCGIAAAMTVHGLWNGMASMTTDSTTQLQNYLFFWLPFVAFMSVVTWLVRKAAKSDRETLLSGAAAVGHILPVEARLLSSDRKGQVKVRGRKHVVAVEEALEVASFWNVQARLHPRRAARYGKKEAAALATLP